MVAQLGFILIVDGDERFAGDLAAGLRARKADVEIVASPEAMAEVIERRRPQIILLAVELPKSKGAGYLACNKLKKDPDKASIPVILMSTTATEDDFAKHRKLATHADDYIRKPFSDDEFFKKIGNILGFEISRGDFEQLQEKVHDFLGEKADLEAEIRQKADTIAHLESRITHLQAQLIEKNQRDDAAAQQLQQDVRRLEDLVGELSEQKAVLEAEIELLQGQKQEADADVGHLRDESNALANDIKELEVRRERIRHDLEAVRRQLAEGSRIARETAEKLDSLAAGL